MDALAVVRRRLYDQRLAAEPFDRPQDAVRWLGAMQTQEFAEAKWSIGQRARDCSEADVARRSRGVRSYEHTSCGRRGISSRRMTSDGC